MSYSARALLLVALLACAAHALPPPPRGTSAAALASLSRTLGRDASQFFDVQLTELDNQAGDACAAATGGGDRLITLTARTAVDAVFIAARYMSEVLNASFAWQLNGGNTVPNLPSDRSESFLPAPPGGAVRACRSVAYTYYQNVVQSSYSNVWWTFERWLQEIDWMALHGVNVALAFTGQEALWRDTFGALGLNASTLDAYFAGPAYLSWNRGQGLNVDIGGPLPVWWYAQQLQLGQKVVDAFVDMGVVPILPVFQGAHDQSVMIVTKQCVLVISILP